jgi:hypothetical protein
MTVEMQTTHEQREVTQAHNAIVIGAMKMNKLAYYMAGFMPHYNQMDDEGRYKSVVHMIDYSMDGEKLLSASWPLNRKTNALINNQFVAGYKMKVRELELDGI